MYLLKIIYLYYNLHIFLNILFILFKYNIYIEL